LLLPAFSKEHSSNESQHLPLHTPPENERPLPADPAKPLPPENQSLLRWMGALKERDPVLGMAVLPSLPHDGERYVLPGEREPHKGEECHSLPRDIGIPMYRTQRGRCF